MAPMQLDRCLQQLRLVLLGLGRANLQQFTHVVLILALCWLQLDLRLWLQLDLRLQLDFPPQCPMYVLQPSPSLLGVRLPL